MSYNFTSAKTRHQTECVHISTASLWLVTVCIYADSGLRGTGTEVSVGFCAFINLMVYQIFVVFKSSGFNSASLRHM